MAPLEETRSEPDFFAWTAASSYACPKLILDFQEKKNRGASPMATKDLSEKIMACHSKTVKAVPETSCMEDLKEYKACLEYNYRDLKHTKCNDLRVNLQKCVSQNVGPFDE